MSETPFAPLADGYPLERGLTARGLVTRAGGPVDLDVGGGEIVALTGPSGSGKSLLLRALVDLDPHAGRVWLAGIPREAHSAPQWRRRVAYLPAHIGWWAETAGAHMTDPAAATALARRLRLDPDLLARAVGGLSTGEAQRLGLIRLLLADPGALLLDEPTSALDPEATEAVEDLLREQRDGGAVILMVTHDRGQAARLADRVFALDRLLAGGDS